MEIKDLIGLTFLFVATLVCIGATCVSQRARDAAFFLMTAGAVLGEKLDINFLSHFWYRGTTRGLEFSFVDVLAVGVLVSSFLFPRRGEARCYWPAGLGLWLLFFAWACFSVLIAEPKVYGLFELSKMVRGFIFLVAAAWYLRSERELVLLVTALGVAVCLQGALVIKQRWLDGLYRVTGNLDHANSLSMYLCLVAPIFVAAATSTLPKSVRWFSGVAIALATLGIVLTISRAGIPTFAFVMLGATAMCISWRLTAKKVAVAVLIALGVAGLVFKSWDVLKARYSQSSLAEEYRDENLVESRGYFLRLAWVIVADRFLGVGLNNWSYWVSKQYGAQIGTPYEDYDDLDYAPSKEILPSFSYAAPAHNLGALVVGELGVPGLLLFALLGLRWFQMGCGFLWPRVPAAMHRIAVGIFFGGCGLCLQSITEWTFRQTQIYLTFHLLAGALAGLCYAKRQARRRAASPVAAERPTYHWVTPALAR